MRGSVCCCGAAPLGGRSCVTPGGVQAGQQRRGHVPRLWQCLSGGKGRPSPPLLSPESAAGTPANSTHPSLPTSHPHQSPSPPHPTNPTPPHPTQLADFLKGPVERFGGLMPLPDVYCLFNRARGAELVSPDDLLAAVKLFPAIGAPFQARGGGGRVGWVRWESEGSQPWSMRALLPARIAQHRGLQPVGCREQG